jgi:hypothetical protein
MSVDVLEVNSHDEIRIQVNGDFIGYIDAEYSVYAKLQTYVSGELYELTREVFKFTMTCSRVTVHNGVQSP